MGVSAKWMVYFMENPINGWFGTTADFRKPPNLSWLISASTQGRYQARWGLTNRRLESASQVLLHLRDAAITISLAPVSYQSSIVVSCPNIQVQDVQDVQDMRIVHVCEHLSKVWQKFSVALRFFWFACAGESTFLFSTPRACKAHVDYLLGTLDVSLGAWIHLLMVPFLVGSVTMIFWTVIMSSPCLMLKYVESIPNS